MFEPGLVGMVQSYLPIYTPINILYVIARECDYGDDTDIYVTARYEEEDEGYYLYIMSDDNLSSIIDVLARYNIPYEYDVSSVWIPLDVPDYSDLLTELLNEAGFPDVEVLMDSYDADGFQEYVIHSENFSEMDTLMKLRIFRSLLYERLGSIVNNVQLHQHPDMMMGFIDEITIGLETPYTLYPIDELDEYYYLEDLKDLLNE